MKRKRVGRRRRKLGVDVGKGYRSMSKRKYHFLYRAFPSSVFRKARRIHKGRYHTRYSTMRKNKTGYTRCICMYHGNTRPRSDRRGGGKLMFSRW